MASAIVAYCRGGICDGFTLSGAALLIATPAFAHTGEGTGGFLAGLAHPVFGPDHVVAMVAVGLWGAFLGSPRSGYCRSCFRW